MYHLPLRRALFIFVLCVSCVKDPYKFLSRSFILCCSAFGNYASEILDIMVILCTGFVELCQKYIHISQCTYNMQNGLERRS